MHEFKHGELKSGRSGKGGKVKNRRQAIAIALEEAGASKYQSNRRNLRRTESKEAEGHTAQQERESKTHVDAHRKREGDGGEERPQANRVASRGGFGASEAKPVSAVEARACACSQNGGGRP